MDLRDLGVEHVVLENMLAATHVQRIPVVYGLEPGNPARALEGEDVGTLVEGS